MTWREPKEAEWEISRDNAGFGVVLWCDGKAMLDSYSQFSRRQDAADFLTWVTKAAPNITQVISSDRRQPTLPPEPLHQPRKRDKPAP